MISYSRISRSCKTNLDGFPARLFFKVSDFHALDWNIHQELILHFLGFVLVLCFGFVDFVAAAYLQL